MKKTAGINLIWTVALLHIILSSCSSTNALRISVIEPAPVHIPGDIQSVGIVDRSVPSEESKQMDQVDKVLSVEGKNLDKDGARQSIVGLQDELMASGEFELIKILSDIDLKNPGMGVFPAALSWPAIKELCEQHEVDALITLAFYDTDTKIDYDAVPIKIQAPMGISIPAIEHHAKAGTSIKTGWRIYDPVNQYILDEFVINEYLQSSGAGVNPLKAVEAIVVGRKENILQVSNDVGHAYALRLFPYKIRVSRDYFVRGTDNFEIGKRRAQTGDWNGAAELWEKEIENPKKKIAGRAHYNMAIINEINGDLDAAVDWASKSYTDYKNKDALRYLNVLKRRIEKNRVLEQQMDLKASRD